MNKDILKKIFETLTPGITDAFQGAKVRRFVRKNRDAVQKMVQTMINDPNVKHVKASDLLDIDPTDVYEPTVFDIDSDD